MPAGKKQKPLIVITGSSGNIGTALREALKKDYRVVGFDQEGTNCDYPFDITSEASVKLAFKRFKEDYSEDPIAAVIHLAAYFDFSGEDSPLYEAVNVNGTKFLLETLQDFKVERFIYSSTMLVHKPCERGELINESSELEPKWRYPESKLNTEKIIEQYHGKIPFLILRLAGLYNETGGVPTLVQQITRIYERSFKSHLYAGDIKAGQSFIHQNDLIKLFEQAVKHRQNLPEKEIILAGEPETLSYEQLQTIIRNQLHDEKSSIVKIPAAIAKAGAWLEEKSEPLVPDDFDQGEKPFIRPFMIDRASDHYALDIRKARKALDWEPEHRLEKTLPVILQNLQKDPDKWYKNNGLTMPEWMKTLKNKNAEKIRQEYEKQFRTQHQNNIWAHFLNITLGFWLITSPYILGYQSFYNSVSDVISGGVLVILAFLCLSWRLAPFRWLCTALGTWVMFAPLIFWVPTAGAYLNDTLVGALIFGFAVLVRPDIGVSPDAAMTGPSKPPGWDFSPSSWTQRLPIIALAFIGFFISRYLTAYQLGHIDGVWEPFFSGAAGDGKNGTEEIITSYVSEAWPVPDAGVGALVYALEILTGFIGGVNRWRTMPWLVFLFGFMIIPLGVVSITFIVIQPVLLDTWCTLCLIAALAMLLQVPYSFDEIIASGQFLWRRWKKGRPVLRILFTGDTDEPDDKALPSEGAEFEQSPGKILKDILYGGIDFPWTLLGCIAIGGWLMFTRLSLGNSGAMANADHLIGSLIITFSITALAEIIRSVRLVNILFALVLCITPFVYGVGLTAMLNSIICGVLLFGLSLPRGKVMSNYGTWNRYIV